MKGSSRRLPIRPTVFHVDKEDDPVGIDAAVVASLARGVPVSYGSEEEGIVVGVTAGGERIAMHAMEGPRGEAFVASAWPARCYVAVWDSAQPRASPADRRQLAVEAVQSAVDMATGADVGNYAVGSSAWASWLAQLAGAEDTDRGLQHGNGWLYVCLMEHRTQAVKYLRSVAGLFGAPTDAHLCAAADEYELLVQVLAGGSDDVACGGSQSVAAAAQVAPMAWQGTWGSHTRAEQARRLEHARQHEQSALQQLALALDAAKL